MSMHVTRSSTYLRQLGFSLVELLVVMAILGVLALTLFPIFKQMSREAQSSQCVSNLKQLHLATMLWSADSGNRLPDRRWWSYDKGKSTSVYSYEIAPYLGLQAGSSGQQSGLAEAASVFTCPASHSQRTSTQPWARTYSINAHACSTGEGLALDERWYPRSIHQIERPSEMALYMDGAVSSAGGGAYWTNVQAKQVKGHSSPLLYPHNDAINVVFVDGHVESIIQEEMETNYSQPSIRFWQYNAP